MASFQSKLARLTSLPGPGPAAPSADAPAVRAAPAPSPSSPSSPASRPSLDDLRERIARIVAKGPAPAPRADPTRGELPFLVEHTEPWKQT